MKNSAIIYLLLSLIGFCAAMQIKPGAWWGHAVPGEIRTIFLMVLISFLFSFLAFIKSLAQIKQQRGSRMLNWISLTAGIIWSVFSGFAAFGIARIIFV